MEHSSNQNEMESGTMRLPDSHQSPSSDVALPSISLPKGGGAIQGIEDKFQVNAVSGTATLGIPMPLSASRNGFMPTLGLHYNSGSGNSPFGLGWSMEVPKITRKTQKELPQYQDEIESDTFILSDREDLVPVLKQEHGEWIKDTVQRIENGIAYTVLRYRPRIEGDFARIERWVRDADKDTHWRTSTPGNVHSYYGETEESRISDPKDATHVFEWKLSRSHDDKGNTTHYYYKKEDFAGVANRLSEKNRLHHCTQLYLKKVCYGVKTPYYFGDDLPTAENFLFQLVLDYGEHDTASPVPLHIHEEREDWTVRKDPFSSYRSGFEIRTYRKCHRVLLFHCFDIPELPHNPYLTKSLTLQYEDALTSSTTNTTLEGFSYLVKTTQKGHQWEESQQVYTSKQLPDFDIQYQPHEWNTQIYKVSESDSVHAPVGIQDRQYLWMDLFNEGIAGILAEKEGGWFYKSNLGNGTFSHAQQVAPKPSFQGVASGQLVITELEGNGVKSLVQLQDAPQGFFTLTPERDWKPFQAFKTMPNIDLEDANVRAIDLNGNGVGDLLVTEEEHMRWYPSTGVHGFAVSKTIAKAIREEEGPAIVFKDAEQSIFLSDMSGDGLTDIVRIRNGEICYWPNLGHGHFGAKVTMENAPIFDHPDHYDTNRLRLADIDGSGTIDVVYLGKSAFTVWRNHHGSTWSLTPQRITPFPQMDTLADVQVIDFLGTGTACIVYTASSPKQQRCPMQYIDLMDSKKPHVLISYQNNTGKEVTLQYKSSTHFYLEDKKEGNPWITTLPFPVHCIWKTRVEDKIRKTVFTSAYRYRHGYYDAAEREYRGFARVEQLDTEEFSEFRQNEAENVVEEALHQPPVQSISWFHNGAFLQGAQIQEALQKEYFVNTAVAEHQLPKIKIAAALDATALQDAFRACKGLPVRKEMYTLDATPKHVYPFTTSSGTYKVIQIQPKGTNKHAVFQVLPAEDIAYQYDQNPDDPRISHTLVLDTDEYGNVLKTAAVVYPRVQRPMGIAAISDEVWQAQQQHHITYAELEYTNDIIQSQAYRLRVPYEKRTYEIGGLALPTAFFFESDTLFNQLKTAVTIPYEASFTAGIQKRLSYHGRGYFFKDDLSEALPLGALSILAISHRHYELAFTEGIVPKYYGDKVTEAMLLEAKYVHSEGDLQWWTQTGLPLFSDTPQNDFYTPVGGEDIYGNQSFVSYDAYHMMVVTTTNALGYQTEAIHDYRTLSAIQITDINHNRAAVALDELGMVVASAVMGKEGAGEGDTLADPTVRIAYEVLNWQNHQQPNYVHSSIRERHGDPDTAWQERYEYTDGSGSVIMTKTQAAPGKAKRWNALTQAIEEVDANPRWVGNGRTVLDNKGNPIKQYEPYFSTTHAFEWEDALVTIGQSPIVYYDPLGRVIRTEYPDGTFSKVEFDPWYFASYDVNDTVKDSTWYLDNGSPDPVLDPEPIDPKERAAWLAAKHYDTPSIFYTNALGQPIMTTVDYGGGKKKSVRAISMMKGQETRSYDEFGREVSFGATNLIGMPMYNETADKGEKWSFQDVMGKLLFTWDAKGNEFSMTYDATHRVVSSYVQPSGGAKVLYAHVVYANALPENEAIARNVKGKIYQYYDQSGCVTVNEVDYKGNPIQIDKQLTQDYTQTIDWTVLEGLATVAEIEAAAAPVLEVETFSSSATYDAINRPISSVFPDQSVVQPSYDEANMLTNLSIQIRGSGDFVTFLEGQDYDAKGQRQFARYGNGFQTHYEYDPLTFRLTRLLTKATGALDTESVQDLRYTYDPKGNIVQSSDEAQQPHYFNNAVVRAVQTYEYDAVYQLLKATGREHASATQTDHNPSPVHTLPQANTATAVRHYTQHYQYDDCGNILQMQHIATGGNWTRRYRYAYQDDPTDRTNRLRSTSTSSDPIAGPFSATYQYDLHGNIIQMPHLQAMQWNYADQLTQVDLGGGGTAFYGYDQSGNRVRKVIERQGGQRIERIYLGGVEIYREYQGNAVRLERSTLHVSDNTGKIAQVDTKTLDTANIDAANPLHQPLFRYQFGNHLGSATLETDADGNLISYEEYHPFGTSAYRSSANGSAISLKRYRFSGKERDEETGFYYFGARYYAAWLGRWTSCDPAGFIDGLNLYRYVRNNPVKYIDPNGTDPDEVGTTISDATIHTNSPEARRQIDRQFPVGKVVRGREGTYRITGPSYWSETHNSNMLEWTDVAETTNEQSQRSSGSTTTNPITNPSTSTPNNTTNGSPQGSPSGSPDGTTAGDPNGPANRNPNPNPNGTTTGSTGGSGNRPPERNFWNRGGSALLGGLLLLGAGLLTIFTAGATTPLLVLLAGGMATAGGIAVTTTSTIQLGMSYSGNTTAEQDRRTVEALHTTASLSSPFGLVGGTAGAMIADDPQEGLRTGALVGNVAELGYGVTSLIAARNAARNAPGAYTMLSPDPNLAGQAATMTPTIPNGTAVFSTHGAAGVIDNAGTMVPVGQLAPMVQATPHGNVTVLACNVANDAPAVQALANQTGRTVTAYTEYVGAHYFNNVVSFAPNAAGKIVPTGNQAVQSVFHPSAWSVFTHSSMYFASPAAATANGAAAQ